VGTSCRSGMKASLLALLLLSASNCIASVFPEERVREALAVQIVSVGREPFYVPVSDSGKIIVSARGDISPQSCCDCGKLTCCPNPGQCIGCGGCGLFCLRP